MQKTPIDDLLDKVNSRYSLVTIISKRARQLIDGDTPLVYTKTIKPVMIAIEEFSEDKIKPVYPYEE